MLFSISGVGKVHVRPFLQHLSVDEANIRYNAYLSDGNGVVYPLDLEKVQKYLFDSTCGVRVVRGLKIIHHEGECDKFVTVIDIGDSYKLA